MITRNTALVEANDSFFPTLINFFQLFHNFNGIEEAWEGSCGKGS